MREWLRSTRGALMGVALLTLMMAAVTVPLALMAATENPSPASGTYYVMTWNWDTQMTADEPDKAEFTQPWPARLVKIQCVARALGGSGSPTYTFTLQEAAGTLGTCAMAAAGTVAEGTISDSAVADEANITLDYDSEGTSPTADDVTVVLIFQRL